MLKGRKGKTIDKREVKKIVSKMLKLPLDAVDKDDTAKLRNLTKNLKAKNCWTRWGH